jgi:type II restriction enzyme
MSKLTEAQEILKGLGLPTAQQNEMSALTLLALCSIKEKDEWKNATRTSMGVSKGIMQYMVEIPFKQTPLLRVK